jgi:hypothetical protein
VLMCKVTRTEKQCVLAVLRFNRIDTHVQGV